MDRNAAIEKIKKCLALGNSAEPHEAAAAMRQAQKLMAAFGVDETDVGLSSMCDASSSVPPGALVTWQAYLAQVVGCKADLRRGVGSEGRRLLG